MTLKLMTDEELNKAKPEELIAEIFRLREALKGPEGFATWREAAVAEKLSRVAAERMLTSVEKQLRDLQDYLSGILT